MNGCLQDNGHSQNDRKSRFDRGTKTPPQMAT